MPKIIGGSLHEHREQTRQKLFAALSALMADQGFDAITLAEIASAAGVGRTAVYNHFPDKESLLLGFITHETEQYAATLQRALDDIEDPTEQLQTYVRQQAALTKVYHLAPGPELRSVLSRGTQQRVREHVMVVEQILRRILAAGIESGAFPEQDLDVTVPLINACLSGRGVPADGPERDRAIAQTEAFVLRAVGAAAPESLCSRPDPVAKRARGGTPPAHHGSHPVGPTAPVPSTRPAVHQPRADVPARGSGTCSPTRPPRSSCSTAPRRPCPAARTRSTCPTGVRSTAVLDLRTAVAAFVVLRFDVPRPKSLTSGDHLQRIVDAMYSSLRVGSSSSFRFEAAGSDSTVFARLAELLAEATGLRYDEAQGELVLRVRRGVRPGSSGDPGWDVLVRVGARPLSARRWRVTDFPGAANATIAAAMVRLGGVDAEERVLNLMCGSGRSWSSGSPSHPRPMRSGSTCPPTPSRPRRRTSARARRDARLLRADCTGPELTEAVGTGWDLLLADPPWGTLHGTHATNAEVHAGMLQAAYDVAAPGARFVVLTHEVKVMERCLRDADALWRVRSTTRVFAKGHHPRIYVLDRT